MGQIIVLDDNQTVELKPNKLRDTLQTGEKQSLVNNIFQISYKDGMYHCPACDKGFKQKNNTVVHYKMVHLKLVQSCTICGLDVKKLRQHMVDVHVAKEKVVCKICSKAYDSGRLIKDHYERVHKVKLDGTPLPDISHGLVKCSVCQEGVSKLRLERHMRFR